MVFNRHLLDEQ